ncbi:LacI family DNA-binding transcriptional regulator [Colwellia sp. 4_MG-2023]|uniref:LacI family DNA-binding transcriptional regulator n=1 Tax=unclassified Colwellia TaxID=196834 RepID=UPI001C09D944|nr:MULTISPECIES: LacI family DNA-binding transcriptional regulator [unclassified Colwellia]MBU2924118.1 LacI family transcriptional regulator [Colwellia sp. C2M11]MDO6486822.1 LacI family DNA-binding transcriptional regulator [Colwellia sp. 6_MG-2023]MDO6506152.1 LacI family DNA-binding transcriptional regulator [Colwellia sp. 5_MG-2023]MDO6554788.1 LacI family DNA-binding transcriptional regulator [Colwellia sp. 4_MG-2023]MDO6652009.1 LacI family DNA-binding transcriptional regulator [Colwell
MATIYEVSSLAGVSLATVSRVINNNTRVSDKTRKKVEEAMSELGYRPNSIAQSLASNRTNSVGILVSELHGPFFGQMMAGIESELRAAGKHVIITTGHSEEDREKEGIDFLISRNCDALIVHLEGLTDEYIINLSKGSTPIYFMSKIIPELEENCIYLDNELGGYLAAKALIDKGHTQIAYISGPKFKPDSKDRLIGHKRALSEHNLAFNDELYFEGDFKETGGKAGLKQFLTKKLAFTALVCANDEMASGAMTYAREHGFALPQDLSIIGFDNIIFSRHIYPKLTTIDNPVYDMGHMAAKLVLKNVYQQKNLTINHSFEPALINRDSIAQL